MIHHIESFYAVIHKETLGDKQWTEIEAFDSNLLCLNEESGTSRAIFRSKSNLSSFETSTRQPSSLRESLKSSLIQDRFKSSLKSIRAIRTLQVLQVYNVQVSEACWYVIYCLLFRDFTRSKLHNTFFLLSFFEFKVKSLSCGTKTFSQTELSLRFAHFTNVSVRWSPRLTSLCHGWLEISILILHIAVLKGPSLCGAARFRSETCFYGGSWNNIVTPCAANNHVCTSTRCSAGPKHEESHGLLFRQFTITSCFNGPQCKKWSFYLLHRLMNAPSLSTFFDTFTT